MEQYGRCTNVNTSAFHIKNSSLQNINTILLQTGNEVNIPALVEASEGRIKYYSIQVASETYLDDYADTEIKSVVVYKTCSGLAEANKLVSQRGIFVLRGCSLTVQTLGYLGTDQY